jgi:twitching motility protein PilT
MISARAMTAKSTEKLGATQAHPLAHVDQYLSIGQRAGASDVHLGVNAAPVWRLHGTLQPIWPDAPRLSPDDTRALANGFLTESHKTQLAERGDTDFAYANNFGRFRTSVVRQRLGVDLVFRIINTQVRTMDDLGLPDHLKLLTRYQNGLILVTGSVGSGKSTTLAALVEQVNLERREHIITLEDPIEYILEPKGCHITQREVRTHTRSFAAALRGALREDPDVIMVGEMRDLETISTALHAAETGHMVFSTLHTLDAVETINRVISIFPPPEQKQIRMQLAAVLRAIISQRLVRRCDAEGRVPAVEVMINTAYIRECVLVPEKTRSIRDAIAAGTSQYGMQTFDQSLWDLFQAQLVNYETALENASNADDFKLRMQGIASTSDISRQSMQSAGFGGR